MKNPSSMQLTILGCGTSTGVPLLGCTCTVCRSREPKNKRLRASAWWKVDGKSILIDTSVDLRQQALREKIFHVDAVLFTHPHADHTHGIDELRNYNFLQKAEIAAFGNAWTCQELVAKFPYIFTPPQQLIGGGVPQVKLTKFSTQHDFLDVQGVRVIPLSLEHGPKECVGYRIGSVAYVTDCSYIPDTTLARMQGLEVLVLDCLRLAPHGTHFNLDQALEAVSKLRPRKTYLTHLGHDFDYRTANKKLPRGVALAYDGLKINMRNSK